MALWKKCWAFLSGYNSWTAFRDTWFFSCCFSFLTGCIKPRLCFQLDDRFQHSHKWREIRIWIIQFMAQVDSGKPAKMYSIHTTKMQDQPVLRCFKGIREQRKVYVWENRLKFWRDPPSLQNVLERSTKHILYDMATNNQQQTVKACQHCLVANLNQSMRSICLCAPCHAHYGNCSSSR